MNKIRVIAKDRFQNDVEGVLTFQGTGKWAGIRTDGGDVVAVRSETIRLRSETIKHKQTSRKLVFQYPNGSFYRWGGECPNITVDHSTHWINNAEDFKNYTDLEPPDEEGKFVWAEANYILYELEE